MAKPIMSKLVVVNGVQRKVRCFPGYASYYTKQDGRTVYIRGYIARNKKGEDVFKPANKKFASLLSSYEPK